MAVYSKAGPISYKAQSQDEEALVHAAARLKMIFLNRNGPVLGMNNFSMSIITSLEGKSHDRLIAFPLSYTAK